MTADIRDITIGGLTHDIGKVVYRSGDGREHSASGREFLSRVEWLAQSPDILDMVAYHHGRQLSSAKLPADSPAYIVYVADNISAGADRRDMHSEGDGKGFDPATPLASVFNILNGKSAKYGYTAAELQSKRGINYPRETPAPYTRGFYGQILQRLLTGLDAINPDSEYVNSLLDLLEAWLTFVPSSTNQSELADISLFDHCKTTAAIAACIKQYLDQGVAKGGGKPQPPEVGFDAARGQGEAAQERMPADPDAGAGGFRNLPGEAAQGRVSADYRTEIWDAGKSFYDRPCFLLYSFDLSGIQSFIYTISGKGALKSLRSRSFYLEMTVEHIADTILREVGLSRANLIYTGGGHAYMLLANTGETLARLEGMSEAINRWFLEHFQTDLYIATAYVPCSGNDLMNQPREENPFPGLYRRLGRILSEKKLNRYTAGDIRMLNGMGHTQSLRECRECRRTERLDAEGLCPVCKSLAGISGKLIQEGAFFLVTADPPKDREGLPLPYRGHLSVVNAQELGQLQKESPEQIIAFYSKNAMHTGQGLSTNLWMGDYAYGGDFQDLAESAQGIPRIGVLRADVDNLGLAFVEGLRREGPDPYRYVTLSRTAVLSRQLSMFFKYHINEILAKPVFSLGGQGTAGKRKAVVVYSGGDDVFLVGAWDDCVGAAMDLSDAFERFTQGRLHMSAGIGVYAHSYPIKRMAAESGDLEYAAKNLDEGKNAVALFADGFTYHWKDLAGSVVGEKLRLLQGFFAGMDERGKAMLYRVLEYLRQLSEGGAGGRINLARLAYLLARLEPTDGDAARQGLYKEFSKNVYAWALWDAQRKDLECAILLYAYLTREAKT